MIIPNWLAGDWKTPFFVGDGGEMTTYMAIINIDINELGNHFFITLFYQSYFFQIIIFPGTTPDLI